MSDFIKMLSAVFFGNLLTLLVVIGYMHYQAEKAVQEVAAVMMETAEQMQIASKQAELRARERNATLAAEQQRQRTQQAELVRAQEAGRIHIAEAETTKELAWKRFYKPSKNCEVINDVNLVACGNEKIRARRQFEASNH